MRSRDQHCCQMVHLVPGYLCPPFSFWGSGFPWLLMKPSGQVALGHAPSTRDVCHDEQSYICAPSFFPPGEYLSGGRVVFLGPSHTSVLLRTASDVLVIPGRNSWHTRVTSRSRTGSVSLAKGSYMDADAHTHLDFHRKRVCVTGALMPGVGEVDSPKW